MWLGGTPERQQGHKHDLQSSWWNVWRWTFSVCVWCLRWEHLCEGVVVVGVPGILPSLLRDRFACVPMLLESN